jgi:hypothetical protein
MGELTLTAFLEGKTHTSTSEPSSPPVRIHETSREAYHKIIKDGTANTQAGTIFSLLLRHPEGLTNNEIRRHTSIQINAVTARIVELRKIELANGENLVTTEIQRRDNITGMRNAVWKINPAYHHPRGKK